MITACVQLKYIFFIYGHNWTKIEYLVGLAIWIIDYGSSLWNKSKAKLGPEPK